MNISAEQLAMVAERFGTGLKDGQVVRPRFHGEWNGMFSTVGDKDSAEFLLAILRHAAEMGDAQSLANVMAAVFVALRGKQDPLAAAIEAFVSAPIPASQGDA